jgi:hypothetical protein
MKSFKKEMQILKNIQNDLSKLGWHSTKISFTDFGNFQVDLTCDRFPNIRLRSELQYREPIKDELDCIDAI